MKDPNNGNSLDMRVAVHKIHRGNTLPSVVAGTPYVLHMDTRADDFSTVWFPVEVQTCGMCHQAAQGDRWTQKPSQAVCSSCHDLTAFGAVVPPGMKRHGGGVQVDDSKCSSCHIPSGTFLAVTDAHATALSDPAAPKIVLAIVSVTSTAPGQVPVLRFKVTLDGAPYDLLATPFTSLAATLAGPTSDYAQTQPVTYAIQGAAPVGTLVADAGTYVYTFPAPIPLGATGTYAVGMEGAFKPNPLPTTKTYSPMNPVTYVAVTDPVPVPRRTVVDRTKCNSCHFELAAHGGTSKNPDYCVMCHTPNKVNDLQVARFEVPATVANSVNFKVMVHKIHRGDDLAQQPYVLGGAPGPTPALPGGTPIDFGKVRFPGKANACWSCHAGTSYLLPLPIGLLPTKMSQTLACNDATPNSALYCASRSVTAEALLAPIGAACTACHDEPSTLAHAQSNTAPDGAEACETCHGPGKQEDVQAVHALQP
jgi:OmcA/MtrC family decaheme c-type cytochrome